jgi:hypothetical protein
MGKKEYKRLQFDFSTAAIERLDEIVELTECSKNDSKLGSRSYPQQLRTELPAG